MNGKAWELQRLGTETPGDLPPARRQHNAFRRYALIAGVATGGLVTLILSLRFLAVPLLLSLWPQLDVTFFDWGVYGAYPQQWYQTIDMPSPCPRTVQWNESCSESPILLSLSGPGLDYAGPLILDSQGELIWTTNEYGAAGNVKVQRYRGKDYLTFWAGEKLQESGQGMYYMLDSTYNIAFTVKAVGDGLYGDLHEFKITTNGTALITVYNKTHLDPDNAVFDDVKDGFIIDGIVQEIDIATGEMLFQWRASDHLDNTLLQTSSGGYVDLGALDYFHINSIEKDGFGNYLISVRHLHMLLYVSGSTGEILWAVGGASDDFEDVSGGAASDFMWQHDARWIDRDQGLISLFDNGIARHHYSDADHSEGRFIKLDLETRTVELIRTFASPSNIRSASQGSVQLLEHAEVEDDQHVFVGWGSSGAYSEFAMDGKLLCETHFAASLLFYFERAKSYRAIKAPEGWKMEPSWDPSAKTVGDVLYVSWIGATEVAYWMLQGQMASSASSASVAGNQSFVDLDTVAKESFETSFEPEKSKGRFVGYRIAALDAEMNVLRFSNIEHVSASSSKKIYVWSVLLAVLAAALVTMLLVRFRRVLLRQSGFKRAEVAYRRIG